MVISSETELKIKITKKKTEGPTGGLHRGDAAVAQQVKPALTMVLSDLVLSPGCSTSVLASC